MNLKKKYGNQWISPNQELLKEENPSANDLSLATQTEPVQELTEKTVEKAPQSIGQVLKKTQSAQAKLNDLLASVTGKSDDDGLSSFKDINDSILQSKTETYSDSGIEEVEMSQIKSSISIAKK